jgi:hypothetical protein
VLSIIQSAPFAVFLVMMAIPLGMAGVAIFAGLRARERAALIAATPTSNIGMAEDGYREFEGTVEMIDNQPLVAPLTSSPCAWYHTKVEEWRRGSSGDTSKSSWHVVNEHTSGAPFILRDATGVCIVHPRDAEVTPTDKSVWYGATIEPSDTNPARVGPTEHAKPSIEVAGGPNSKYRYSEERIYAGNHLLALGTFSSGRFKAPGDAPEGLYEEAEEGELDEYEYTGEGPRPARARAVSKARLQHGGPGPFILSTTPQQQHVQVMATGGNAALGIAVLPLAIAGFLIWVRFF